MAAQAKQVLANLKDGAQARTASAMTSTSIALNHVEGRAERKAKARHSGDTRVSRVAQEGTLMTLLTLGILGVIGVLIYSQVSTSLPTPEDETLAATQGDIDEGFADALGLLPIVLIVMMAALVIAVVQRFRG